jgi:hypothetical protein
MVATTELHVDGRASGVKVFMANTWLSRLVGLLNRSGLPDNEALVLLPCASIHTLWMRFSIDVVFLGENGVVLGMIENLRPFRFCMAPKGTHAVLELASGNAKRTGINLDQVLKFV